MRFFTVSELWGPFPCEEKGCKEEAFTIVLTDEENAMLPEETGPEAIRFIFKMQFGKALCDDHADELRKSL